MSQNLKKRVIEEVWEIIESIEVTKMYFEEV